MTNDEVVRLRRLGSDIRQPCTTIREIFSAECLRCSACCLYYSQRTFAVPVRPTDKTLPHLVQIGPRLKTVNKDSDWDVNRYMRIAPLKPSEFFGWKGFKKCVSLIGVISKTSKCGIYETRPESCSSFQPGSPACQRARQWLHLPLPQDLVELGHS